MRNAITIGLAVSLLWTFALGAPAQQSTSASIEGAIIRAGGGEFVNGARVTLTRMGGGPATVPANAGLLAPTSAGQPPQATPNSTPGAAPANAPAARGGPATPPPPIPYVTTDSSGKFSFKGLDPGAYRLQVQANGYVGQAYGQRYPGGPGAPINLTPEQEMKAVSISLTPTANLGGRIVDRAGQPIPNMPVQLFRFIYDPAGQRTAQIAGTAQSNDRGQYRIYWVTPGRYYLMAGSALPAALAGMIGIIGGNPNQLPEPYALAYYPSAASLADATQVNLAPGTEASGMDVVMSPQVSYRVRGKLTDSRTGQAPPKATLALVEQNSERGARSSGEMAMLAELGGRGSYNASRGSFEFRDVARGTYMLTATVTDPQPPAAGPALNPANAPAPSRATGSMTVLVGETDVEGINVTINPPVALPGRIRIDGQLPANLTLDRMRVRLAPVIPGSSPNTAVNAEGAFRFENVPNAIYRVSVNPMPPGGYLKEARLDGTDVLSNPLTLSGQAVNSLDLIIGTKSGQVDGTLLDNQSQPVAVSQVVLIPDRGRDRIDLYKMSTTDGNGRFAFAGVPPGDYQAFSWDGIEPYTWFDPEFLKQSDNKGKRVRVSESSKETIEVKVIPGGLR